MKTVTYLETPRELIAACGSNREQGDTSPFLHEPTIDIALYGGEDAGYAEIQGTDNVALQGINSADLLRALAEQCGMKLNFVLPEN